MASSLLTLFFCTLSIFLSSCSSQILLPLTHTLSNSKLLSNTHHLLKTSSLRSTKRHHHRKHHHHQQQQQHNQISLPLSPGSDYILSFTIGSTPIQQISLYMDTGSDLVWFPCSPFECILCENKYDSNIPLTPFNISSTSHHLPCNSPACSAAHSSLPSSDLCTISKCPLETIETSDCSSFSCPPFYYAYGDGSLIANLYQDKLSLPSSMDFPNITFGCAHTTLGEPIGVAGFGQGVLSLPAQLSKHSPQLGKSFSYCLISHSFDVSRVHKPSPLILGRNSMKFRKQKQSIENGVEENEEEFLYTPILHNPTHPYFYTVGLEAITVGKKRIPVTESLKRVNRAGDGGMVVDSGTTFTMLPTYLHEAVVTEFEKKIGNELTRASEVEEQTGLSPCYYYQNEGVQLAKVPRMVLHFVGNTSVTLPRKNYFYGNMNGGDDSKKRKAGCLMLMNGGDEEKLNGPAATLGNYQQQGFEVVYDLEMSRVGFARRHCASLWDSLN